MEQILVNAWVTLIAILLGLILSVVIGYLKGYEKGYDKGRRDERVKNYIALQNQKPNFIDAD